MAIREGQDIFVTGIRVLDRNSELSRSVFVNTAVRA